jgi:epoxide hydrolase 4
MSANLPPGWVERTITVNGLGLHYVEAGEGFPVVLLHGFPEFWYTWRYQIPALVNAGFRVIAPDLPGFNLSDKPSGLQNYRIEVVAQEISQFIRSLGIERAAVVGHDWGGSVAWGVPMADPELVEKLLVLNAPHPVAYLKSAQSRAQLKYAGYMAFVMFNLLPRLPEILYRRSNFARMENALRHDVLHPGAFSDEDIARYKEALAQPGALTGGLNYYRANFRRSFKEFLSHVRPIQTPTLLIWGDQDRYLGLHLIEAPEIYAEWVPNIRIEHIPDASHWVESDAPQRVNELLLGFLRGQSP